MPTKKSQDLSVPPTPPQSIPLRDLIRPNEITDTGNGRTRFIRDSSKYNSSIGLRPVSSSGRPKYERLGDLSPDPVGLHNSEKNLNDDERLKNSSKYVNQSPDLQQATGFAGLIIPSTNGSRLPQTHLSPYDNEDSNYAPLNDNSEHNSSTIFAVQESDTIPLTDSSSLKPVHYLEASIRERQPFDKPRVRFQSVNYGASKTNRRPKNSDDDLVDTEAGIWPNMPSTSQGYRRSRLASMSPSNATGALSRAGSIMRAMSKRVVNISGETEMIEATAHLEASRENSIGSIGSKGTIESLSDESNERYQPKRKSKSIATGSYPVTYLPTAPIEKAIRFFGGTETKTDDQNESNKLLPNPLRGRTLGIFSPESQIRNKLCDLLVYPLTEPLILILIIIQAILLAVESSQDVNKSPRQSAWGLCLTDYALLVLFIVFTLELAARIIVSGFIFNAHEYSSQTHTKSSKVPFICNIKRIFVNRRNFSVKTRNLHLEDDLDTPSLIAIQSKLVKTVEQAQRLQLARRAFLRHSFNRLDFVAVCAFWVTFILYLTGIEDGFHLYIFRMLSCLRILRLLALTNGTAIILRSLKKAAPLLLNVSFLIGFFWLLFAIIGVQSFKSSFDRQCVWIDPADPTNSTGSAFINSFQFCGGQYNVTTGARDPWVLGPLGSLSRGAKSPKGFLCPRGSYCLQLSPDQLPYNGTVNFDNIFQSLELVFVVMTSNTFSDLMYSTMDSDYLASAIFFAGGIVIMTLWLLNLLIAVITSSFQVIREEGKASAFASQAKNMQLKGEELKLHKHTNALKAWFDKTYLFWIATIAYGILCQTFRSSDMSLPLERFIDNSDTVVTLLLLFEIIVRFIVEWRAFLLNDRNLVDLGLAIITTVMLLPSIRNSDRLYSWLTFFQIFRIYRIIIAVPVTRSLISLVLGNSSGIGNLVLFVFLITFLMSIFAVQLFRGELPPEDASGQTIGVTFFTIWNSFLGMYQILSSENWTVPLYDLTSYNKAHGTSWIAGIFVVGWFILGNFILVNMFIAVIQENFDVSEDEKRMHQVKAFLNRKNLGGSSSNLSLSAIIRFGRPRNKKDPLDYGPATMEMLLKDAVVKDFLHDEIKETQEPSNSPKLPEDLSRNKDEEKNSMWQKFKNRFQNSEPNPFYSRNQYSDFAESADPRTMAKEAVSAKTQRKKAQREYLARYPNYNTSLYIFKPNNPIRRLCQKIVGPGRGIERYDGVEPNRVVWYTFSAIIYAAIITMVLIACVTTPLYQKEYFDTHGMNARNWIVWTDMSFTILFSIEFLIKAIADGFYWTPNAYFRSSWGLIDAMVLVTFWINVITSLLNDGAVSRAVGAFKALRGLRLLNVSDSTRDTFHSLIIVGGWKILSAAFVSLSLLFPFAIYGVNLFRGQMLSCNDTDPSNIITLADCFGEYNSTPFSSEWPILAPRVVSNPFFDFDNFGSSLFILFQIVSQEGWVDVMWAAQSIVRRGFQPQPFSSQENAIFFVIFNLLATVFILTLFISVFMRNYTEQTGVAFLTAEQRSWLELRKFLRQVTPSKRQSTIGGNKFKSWCYRRAVRKSGRWQSAVTSILILHLIFLLVEYYPQPLWWDETRNYIFFTFTTLFMINVIIRIVGLGWTRFRRSSWDLYSLIVVSGTLGTTVLLLLRVQFQAVIQLHKFFLVMIVLLLIPRNDALDQLFKTAAASGASIGNLLATWLVLFLVYAIALTQAFGLTRFGQNGNNNQNFRTVPKALILLFRLSCGESWNTIMEDYATTLPPFCVSDSNFFNSDCGSSQWARVLFISWNILSMYIFTSLFVSLIYEGFSYVYQHSSGLNKVSREEIRGFKEAWAVLDPGGTGFITKEQFPLLLKELSGVFAMKIYPPEHSVRQILQDIHQPHVKKTSSSASLNIYSDVNLKDLNRRVSLIDSVDVRRSRNQYKLFFEEVMVSADIDRGISFTSVLMILSHYKVIRDNKSLKLEEFLRRRARLQRIEEEVRRKTVLGFFDTMYWSRRFRQHLQKKKSNVTTDIPKLGLEVFGHDREITKQKFCSINTPVLIGQDYTNGSSNLGDFGLDGGARHRHSISPSCTSASPILSPPISPNRAVATGFSLDNVDLGESTQSSRRGSSVSTGNVLDVLDDSAWGESIRRSFAVRRSS